MKQHLPNFIGLGAQKGGTTSLHETLNQHPGIYLPKRKEVHFFDLQYSKGIKWYEEEFKNAKPWQICGEITPYYLFNKEVPARIKKTTPLAKMIVMLRDPVNRSISHFKHAKVRGFEPLDIENALRQENKRLNSGNPISIQRHSYLARSNYIEQLARYEKLFPRKQLLIIKSEDFFTKKEDVWFKLLKFLELEYIKPPIAAEAIANKGNNNIADISDRIRQELRVSLDNTYKEVEKRYGIKWD